MNKNNYTLTMNSDSDILLYIAKLIDLFENSYKYENGSEILEMIKNQLNSLTNVEISSVNVDDYESINSDAGPNPWD